MGCLISSVAIWFFGYGLWEHDWRILFASTLLAVVWPMIRDEAASAREERRQRELLDRLWDDDDLSGSA